MARTGFIGLNWTINPIRAIGFVGFNFNHPNYLIIKVTEKKETPAPLDDIIVTVSANGSSTQYTTDENGYVYISNRDFETASINAISESSEADVIYDSSIQTNQFIEVVLDSDPCLSANPFNRSSFYRFHSTVDLFLENDQISFLDDNDMLQPFTAFCDGCEGEQSVLLPNDYLRNNQDYKPKLILGKDFSFILNGNLFSFGIANYRLFIIDAYGTVIQSDVNFDSATNASNETTVYVSDTLTAGINNKSIRFVFVENTTNEATYISNEIEVRTEEEDLVKLEYRNSSDIFDFNYTNWIDNYNLVYLDLNVIDRQGEYELKQYQEVTTGKVRNQKSQTKKAVTLESFFFDEFAHEAMEALTVHDDILMNGKVMETKEGYQIETNIRNKTQRGRIVMYDQQFSKINLNG